MAGHYGTCETADGDYPKWVDLTNPTIFPNIENDKYPEGTTLAVTFTYANTAKGYFSLGPSRDKTNMGQGDGNEEVWYRGSITSDNNYFLWDAGDTVFFVYSDGHWNISETGSYSQLKQTSTAITSEVRRNGGYACVNGVVTASADYDTYTVIV
jgi:hypothetical protein